jgi:hypothetical protein
MANDKSWITAPFAHPTHSHSLLGILAALMLILLAGLFLVVGAVVGHLALAPGGKPLLSSGMLAAAVVLLIAAVVLLLLLLWCCMGSKQHRVPAGALAMLPLLSRVPAMLRATATALRGSREALGLLHGSLRDAAEAFPAPAPPLPAPPPTIEQIIAALHGAANHLKGSADEIARLHAIEGDLAEAADALDSLATTLGA